MTFYASRTRLFLGKPHTFVDLRHRVGFYDGLKRIDPPASVPFAFHPGHAPPNLGVQCRVQLLASTAVSLGFSTVSRWMFNTGVAGFGKPPDVPSRIILFQFSLQQQQQQSDTGTMELGPTLTEFYAPATSSARKQQLEQGLHAFRTLPNAHLSSLEIIVAIVRENPIVASSVQHFTKFAGVAAARTLSDRSLGDVLGNIARRCVSSRPLHVMGVHGNSINKTVLQQ